MLLITDRFDSVALESTVATFFSVPRGDVPDPADLAAAALVIIVGPIADAERGLELAGAASLALEKGATVVFIYNARFQEFDQRFVYAAVPGIGPAGGSGSIGPAATDPSPHPAFRDYVVLHGQTDLRFSALPDGAEVLAHAVVAHSPYETAPTAVRLDAASGSLYVLPYHFKGNFQIMLERLVQAVLAHSEGRLAALPAFFAELTLPGEDEVVRRIDDASDELARSEAERSALVRHKLLVGHLHAEQLEALVIHELNFVLEGSDLVARDVDERGVEDFEIVDTAGTRRAIAESKAASGGISLGHVSQVDRHRTEQLGSSADELPGLLIVNSFRNDDVLDRRRGEGVSERVVRRARRLNVLVMRTWDLLQLVVRRLSGENDSAEFAAALAEGGGWLEIDEAGLRHHTDDSVI